MSSFFYVFILKNRLLRFSRGGNFVISVYERFEKVSAKSNALDQASHSYTRKHSYPLLRVPPKIIPPGCHLPPCAPPEGRTAGARLRTL